MLIEFDPAKSERNARHRGLPFDMASELDWANAVYAEDIRFGYPERRFIALAYLGTRLHVVCFTPVRGGIRVISFRKANSREVKRYEQATADRR